MDAATYETCRRIASTLLRGERHGHTLNATALVHEAVLKLATGAPEVDPDAPAFYARFATTMRHILVDHARARGRLRRAGGRGRVTLATLQLPDRELPDVDLEALDLALERLARHDERAARIVEMRFFADAPVRAIAAHLGVAERTVQLDWQHARMWLARELARSV